jgi:hypothetical protein
MERDKETTSGATLRAVSNLLVCFQLPPHHTAGSAHDLVASFLKVSRRLSIFLSLSLDDTKSWHAICVCAERERERNTRECNGKPQTRSKGVDEEANLLLALQSCHLFLELMNVGLHW